MRFHILGRKTRTSGFLLALALLVGAQLHAERPNFVFFIADDVSQEDFGCYGHPTIQTPQIDALADAGMRFDNAYLTISSCSPSRCSIITGRYPHNSGAPELHVRLPDEQVRFPELLRQAGYYTVLAGKNHMFGSEDRAFDAILTKGKPSGSEDWLDVVHERPKDAPFFFWFASNDAHRNWQFTEHAPRYDLEGIVVPPYLFDSKVTRDDLASYYHEVSRFDYYVGQVVNALHEQGVLDNTVIVVAADNGRPFPRCKSRLYDSGIKTPWVVHYPKLLQGGATTESFISSIDLSATCLELAGVEVPDCIQGQSFVPILQDADATVREVLFAEQNWHVYSNHSRLVRMGDFAYIQNSYPDQMNLSYESDTSFPAGNELWKAQAAGQTNAAQQQIFRTPSPLMELYDLSKDPDQLVNLAANPEYASVLEQGRALLARWSEQTGDTLPDNPTPHRHAPPRIEAGVIQPKGKVTGSHNPHAELPGASRNAEAIHHPGPIKVH
ncbi:MULTISPECIES: sulfatase [unclassified Lentimonas]|nr:MULTISPECIES: sulfatase [unclassified Lentimonas]